MDGGKVTSDTIDTRNVCFLLSNFYSICIQIENQESPCVSFGILEECHVDVIWIFSFCLIFYSICIQIECIVVLRNKNCWNSKLDFFFLTGQYKHDT